MDGSSIEVHEQEDGFTAVYVDGTLNDVFKNEHNAVERVFALLGVKVVQDDAFMLGQESRSGVALTLAEVAEFTARRAADRAAAEARRLDLGNLGV